MSLWVIEADYNVSQHRLQTAFSTVKLEANWINVAAITQITRHHLIEVKGFVSPGHEGMNAMLQALGKAVVNAGFLGAYAVPVTLKSKTPEVKPSLHATVLAKT